MELAIENPHARGRHVSDRSADDVDLRAYDDVGGSDEGGGRTRRDGDEEVRALRRGSAEESEPAGACFGRYADRDVEDVLGGVGEGSGGVEERGFGEGSECLGDE